jgi:glutathione peroxidase
MSVYDYTVATIDGQDVSLERYRGKVLLIVNTATHCGFTPQYEGLQRLYEAHHNKGFEVLDFPCNQFGQQAPGTGEEINQFCTLKFHTSFPRFAKIEVNGANENPLYTYLKAQKKGVLNSAIKWNFTKFLIDKNGTVVGRFGSDKKPELIESEIVKLLEA